MTNTAKTTSKEYQKHMADLAAKNRLADAAPQLLEALEMHQKLFEEMVKYVGKMALQDYALLNDAPMKARAAIAAAKGDA